jgi:nucleotide-binding universal stress UspA family protein
MGQEAESKIKELVGKKQKDKPKLETRISFGEPFEEIVQEAEKSRVDLIVMGTHGRTGISRALIGSVAERVIRKSSLPVLTVPWKQIVSSSPRTKRRPLRSARLRIKRKSGPEKK